MDSNGVKVKRVSEPKKELASNKQFLSEWHFDLELLRKEGVIKWGNWLMLYAVGTFIAIHVQLVKVTPDMYRNLHLMMALLFCLGVFFTIIACVRFKK